MTVVDWFVSMDNSAHRDEGRDWSSAVCAEQHKGSTELQSRTKRNNDGKLVNWKMKSIEINFLDQ